VVGRRSVGVYVRGEGGLIEGGRGVARVLFFPLRAAVTSGCCHLSPRYAIALPSSLLTSSARFGSTIAAASVGATQRQRRQIETQTLAVTFEVTVERRTAQLLRDGDLCWRCVEYMDECDEPRDEFSTPPGSRVGRQGYSSEKAGAVPPP